ncbi:acyltransferase domain-containing protein [Amycolatopsis sp. Hca4]|uniref:acyltransferase domain-containing protein n=1 Tax=Amycolatopsis sp. Hca4 TaxID=2742131 RepID=UPI001C37C4D2|nr:acyltransferase domain-containing protein [Amycolatopsis sp. Hca4]
MSGTNAHLIVEEAPPAPAEPEPAAAGVPVAVPWVLSGRTEAALRDQAAALEHAPATREADPADVAFSLVTTRTTLDCRAVVVGTETDELLAGVRSVREGTPGAGVVLGRPGSGGGRGVVFVFPGQGSQWAGMGAELLTQSPVFARRIAECEAALRPFTGFSVTDVLRGGPAALDRVEVVQPVLWAVLVSLAEVWRAHGVQPAAVVGHSQGEIAAACVAGALSLEDGARVVALRSKAIAEHLAGYGGMVSVTASEADVEARLDRWAGRVSVAAVNGPGSVVVSGDVDALEEFSAACAEDGLRAKTVPVDYASHSVHVEKIHQELLSALAAVSPGTPEIPFLSTLTGRWVEPGTLDAGYWYDNLRHPVRLEPAVRELLAHGNDVFIEVSPHPVLAMSIQDTIEAAGADAGVLGTLRRDDGGRTRLLTSLAEAHVRGVPVDWTAWCASGCRIELPTYAFQRERYWIEPGDRVADAAGLGLTPAGHPLLGAGLELAGSGATVLTGRLSAATRPWLAEHRVLGAITVPDAVFLEWAAQAGDRAGCGTVTGLAVTRPLVLAEDEVVRIQVTLGVPGEDGTRPVTVHSRAVDGEDWREHAAGTLAAHRPLPEAPAEWPPAHATELDVEELYQALDRSGLHHGPGFAALTAAWRTRTGLCAELTLPAEAGEVAGYALHPALTQAAAALGLAGLAPADGPVLRPAGRGCRCTPRGRPRCGCTSRRPARTPSRCSPWTPPAPRWPAWIPCRGRLSRPSRSPPPGPGTGTRCSPWTGSNRRCPAVRWTPKAGSCSGTNRSAASRPVPAAWPAWTPDSRPRWCCCRSAARPPTAGWPRRRATPFPGRCTKSRPGSPPGTRTAPGWSCSPAGPSAPGPANRSTAWPAPVSGACCARPRPKTPASSP